MSYPVKTNLFAGIPASSEGEWFESLFADSRLKIERIVSHGQASPEGFWYDQDRHEWVALIQGRAGLAFEGCEEIMTLVAGDAVLIPARLRHRVAWTDPLNPTIWLAVHFETPAV